MLRKLRSDEATRIHQWVAKYTFDNHIITYRHGFGYEKKKDISLYSNKIIDDSVAEMWVV